MKQQWHINNCQRYKRKKRKGTINIVLQNKMSNEFNQTNFEMIIWNENLMKKWMTQRGHPNRLLWSSGVCPTYLTQYHMANNESNWRCIFNHGPDLTDDHETIYTFYVFFYILKCENLNDILSDVCSSTKDNFTFLGNWWQIKMMKWWNCEEHKRHIWLSDQESH